MGLVVAGITAGIGVEARAQEAQLSARANGVTLGVEAAGAKAIGTGSEAMDLGLGFGVQGGYALRFGAVSVIPELEINYNRWGTSQAPLDSLWILGVLPGARVAYSLDRLSVWLGVHLGLDHTGAGGCDTCSDNQFGFKVGAGADYAASASFHIGPTVAFNASETANNGLSEWITFGVGGSFGL
jgi:hypothetical protein